MEEEVGVKVTRLRRRLSVEAEDVKSPSTQSTPTKKRGGRLAAKPQLELIDENAPEVEKPKRTRKSIARDSEPDEKAVTPSRRSTRIRSNTSIVSETPVEVEEKGTPSRRSTRIKSNTSIVADTVQYSDSPRAKRAARRTSQVGSDNEAPVTPARQTRRTRKDSTSSIDKQVEPADDIGSQIKEVIVEETEDTIKETKTSTKDKNESLTTRKSPRLVQKTGKSLSPVNDNKENEPESVKNSNKEKSEAIEDSVQTSKTIEEFNLSSSTTNLINKLDEQPKKGKDNLNKTTSAADETPSKSKRHRTKSWTTITSSPSNDNTFLSDTEAIKKKNKIKSSNMSGSGDNLLNTSKKSIHEDKEQDDNKEVSFNSAVSDKAKNKNDKSLLDNETVSIEISTVNTSLKVNKSIIDVNESSSKIREDNLNSSQKNDPNFTEKFFGEAPSGTVQSLVFIEDSDSNTESAEKATVTKKFDSEDQCVPVVEHQLVEEHSKEAKNDLSYEPMDIDETMPSNVSLSDFTDKNKSVKEADEGLEKRKSFNLSQVNNVSIDDNANKSHRRSTVLDMENGKQITLNKSNRKSLVSDNIENQNFKNSNRKSSISTVEVDNNLNKDSNQTDICTSQETLNKSLNKSSRKSSISNPVKDDTDNNSSNIDESDGANKSMKKSKRKSLVTDNNIDKDNKFSTANQSIEDNMANKSKRKSTISTMDTSQTEIDNHATTNTNKSKRKSSIANVNNEEVDSSLNNLGQEDNINKSSNKSKRKSSITDSVMKDADQSSIANIIDNDEVDCSHNNSLVNHDDKINKSSNNSKQTSILNTTSDRNNLNKSKKTVIKDESINKSSVNLERKHSISKTDVEFNVDKKSKRKSSISNLESQIHDKTTEENKSTLVLSQIKDTSETSVQKEIYEFNETNDSTEQLSKSANVPNVNNKDTDKKNLSLTYSTSTPLQQKSFKKLGMQINSSIIAPNSVTKTNNRNSMSKSQKETSKLSQNDEESELSDEEEDQSDEEEEDDDSEEESVDKSKLIVNEADEASDDYESGDSRDEDEREYEKQHEIVEKGETLDSEEDDFSDDSDYEKGSFIVDSDDEDNDLLSGSGDDLSMSADELSMSAKSKKKYNDRKIKEQKKASKEMFESRHKLNDSDKSAKSDKLKMKKNNRQRLESSESESEEDIGVQPKKNRRARIDSSQDISMNQSEADKSVSKKKKKVKRLSESVCEENPTNEKEISIYENNEIENDDPLSLQNVIKEEPRTPQKDLNISTVAITNVEELEKVEVDENVSIMKSNQTTDPLQATVVQDEAMEDDSEESISENEEITKNFESVLDDLNKKSKKVKTQDISLNLDKKNKQKAKEPIVDELNLTHVKSSKKKQNDSSSSGKQDINKSLTNKNIEKVNKSVTIQDDGSSDSIDMKLLFNEDSTDSEIKETAENKNDKQIVEDFIPLKRTEGKTNLLDTSSISNSGKNESILNVSKSNKNKRKSTQPEDIVTKDAEEETNVSFFIDTTGTHTDANKSVTNISLKGSAKKNKNKKDVSFANIEDIKNDDSNDAPLEVSFVSEKNKSKQDLNNTQNGETEVKTPSESAKKKKKNKNKKGLNNSQTNVDEHNVEETDDAANKSREIPVITVTSSNKKKKNKLSVSQAEETVTETPREISHNTSIGSAKKQKQKTVSETPAVEENIIIEESTAVIIEEKITKKRKRKSSANPSIEETAVTEETPQALNDSVIPTNQKKKRKINDADDSTTQAQGSLTVPESQQEQEGSAKKKSKKKNKNITTENQETELTENENESTKKSKKRKERDDDDGKMLSKVVKQNSFDSVHVPRLPANILKQLDDKPKNVAKAKLVSTTSFQVEETRKRRNKPSNYLEQSVYLNDSIEEQTKKSLFKKPKVLPFTPTASTSDFGFTTKFSVNVIPQEVQFIAQSTDTSNFKKDLLQKNRIKKLGTFEKYKRHRNIKISKF